MHRVIMKTPKGMVVDHKNGSGLDNRRRNMRNCTPEENSYNRPPWRGNLGCKGVRYDEPNGTYRAVIRDKGRDMQLGEFDDPIEATRARDRKAHELQREFAYLNFPDQVRRRRRIVRLAGRIVLRSSARGRLGAARNG